MSSRAPLKVYLQCNPRFGKAIHRVVEALADYAPANITMTDLRRNADHIVHHVVGVGNFEDQDLPSIIFDEQVHGQDFSMIQYCLLTTERPDLVFWHRLWNEAAAVWSYYDLDGMCRRELESAIPNFLRLPLGADPNIFNNFDRPLVPAYDLVTTGYVASTETIVECVRACARNHMKMLHIGPTLEEFEGYIDDGVVTCVSGLRDHEVANAYRTSRYVAALRSTEGFELPGIEGMLCGARPITFDLECYTHWYDKSARYVSHAADPDQLIFQLQQILSQAPRPYSQVELGLAQRTFSWPRVCGLFWAKVLEAHDEAPQQTQEEV